MRRESGGVRDELERLAGVDHAGHCQVSGNFKQGSPMIRPCILESER